MDRVSHPIPPLYRKDSRILILGSFPSVKSREGMFFYHHPQNRFWKVISSVFQRPLPVTVEDKKEMLLACRLAVWDVIKSCEITGSADSSIKNVIPNEISHILKVTEVNSIITNGNTAHQLYMKYIFPETMLEAVKLPSTSPANAGYSLDRLIEEWSYLKLIEERE